MQNNIIFLDDSPSLKDDEIDAHFVENIQKLSVLFQSLKAKKTKIQMKLNSSIHELKISENITLKEIKKPLKDRVKEEISSLKLNLSKYPYSIDMEEKITDLLAIDIQYNNHSYESLCWVYTLDTMVISFFRNINQWNSHIITAKLLCVSDKNEDIVEKNIYIKHANTIDHLELHNEWLNEEDLSPDFDEFINNPSIFLPNIILLDGAKEGLKSYRWLFSVIYSKLHATNNDLEVWKDNEPLNISVKYSPGEFEQRKCHIPESMKGYEAHLYFTGIEGRIHYKLQGKKIEVIYIGKKLLI
ncbi:hypothetical protein KTI63_14215 [Acinetobacter guillouiae]|uniref:hypothetical protein n=1 Tax=Acinetobacter guillouiae TaxID=106649 RepID=UPI0021D1BB4B|nr:hypothetical protein [Acinetobacter guillouiae]MCU4493605.1 hypothetical protein [Acinetobacter guillouiae]